MKVHIYNDFDSIDKIINNYAISLQDLRDANPNLDLFKLKKGDKIVIKKKSRIESTKHVEEYQKYLCPHCKKIILIPK